MSVSDDLRQIGVVTKYELLKHLRSKRFFVFIGISALMFILMTALSFILDGKLPGDPKEFMKLYIAPVHIMVVIGVALICASSIASEFEERTALLMFPRPMKKTAFFTGKMLSSFIACGAVIVVYYAVCIVVSLISTGGLDVNTFGSLGMAMLVMLGTGGFALLMSSLFRKSSTAVIVTIAALLLVFNMIDGIMMMNNVEPFFSITYASLDILNYIAGDVSGQGEIIMGSNAFYPTHMMAASICVVWFLITVTLSALLFRRKEF
jgi:ABC-2 type transport system permease protein